METTITKGLTYCIVPPKIPLERSVVFVTEEEQKERAERESTARAKEFFLKYLEQTRGIISIVCEKTGIGRSTYYHWRKTDPEFKQKADEVLGVKPEILEDILYVNAVKGDTRAIMFMLKNLHPKYKNNADKKESIAHIFHHIGSNPEKEKPKDITTLLWEEARRRRLKTEEILKEFAGKELPKKPDGSSILDTEIVFYERYIRDWFKYKATKNIIVEEEES